MRNQIIIAVGLLLVASTLGTQYVPIPVQPNGITFGFENAPLLFEAWYDLACPDSLYSNGQLNIAFRNETLLPYLNNIQMRYHIYPLPYHYNSFYLTQVFEYINGEFGKFAALTFIENAFANQSNYYNNLTATPTEIKYEIAKDTAKYLAAFNVTVAGVFESFDNSDYNSNARTSWKIGAGNAVSGCPTFFANEVVINEAYNFDSNDWVDFFVSLFNPEPDMSQE